MKTILYFIIFFRFSCSNADKHNKSQNKLFQDSNFKLSYMSVGLGSNMFTKQPVFRVNRLDYIYTLEDAWQWKNIEREKPDTLCSGTFRKSSVDSILNLIIKIKDSVIYKTNAGISSGGIDYIDISSDQINLQFKLHNASDSTAQKIVDILNTYIPEKFLKIWLFKS